MRPARHRAKREDAEGAEQARRYLPRLSEPRQLPAGLLMVVWGLRWLAGPTVFALQHRALEAMAGGSDWGPTGIRLQGATAAVSFGLALGTIAVGLALALGRRAICPAIALLLVGAAHRVLAVMLPMTLELWLVRDSPLDYARRLPPALVTTSALVPDIGCALAVAWFLHGLRRALPHRLLPPQATLAGLGCLLLLSLDVVRAVTTPPDLLDPGYPLAPVRFALRVVLATAPVGTALALIATVLVWTRVGWAPELVMGLLGLRLLRVIALSAETNLDAIPGTSAGTAMLVGAAANVLAGLVESGSPLYFLWRQRGGD